MESRNPLEISTLKNETSSYFIKMVCSELQEMSNSLDKLQRQVNHIQTSQNAREKTRKDRDRVNLTITS